MLTSSRRIAIVGGPGSGKTTLALRLGLELDAPVFQLDDVAYSPRHAHRPLAERQAEARRIAALPSWVTEGIYLWWTDALFVRANTIVWLDVSWRVAAARITRRHLRASLAGTNRHGGIANLVRFLRSTRAYYLDTSRRPPGAVDDDGATTRAHTAIALQAFADRLVRVR